MAESKTRPPEQTNRVKIQSMSISNTNPLKNVRTPYRKLDNPRISNKTIDDIIELCGSDCAIYAVRCVQHAAKQGTNKIWVTSEFMQKSLKWGRDKVQKVRKQLESNNFIEIEEKRDSSGRIYKYFTKLNFINNQISSQSLVTEKALADKLSPLTENPTAGIPYTNALNTINSKCLKLEEEEDNFFQNNNEVNLVHSTTTTPTTVSKVNKPSARETTLPTAKEDVNKVIAVFQKATGIAETVLDNTKGVITEMINEFGYREVINDLKKTDRWTNPKTRRLNNIFKSRTTYINKARNYLN